MEIIELATTTSDFQNATTKTIDAIKRDNYLFRTFSFGITKPSGQIDAPMGHMRINNARHYDASFVAAAIQLVSTAPEASDFECSQSGAVTMGAYTILWRIEIDKTWEEINSVERFDFSTLDRTLVITFPDEN